MACYRKWGEPKSFWANKDRSELLDVFVTENDYFPSENNKSQFLSIQFILNGEA